MSDHKYEDIAIIGCGNMGTSLAEKLSSRHRLHLHDRKWEWTQELAKKIEATPYRDPAQAIEHARFVILAIKPQNLSELAPQISKQLRNDQIVISLLAGTSLQVLTNLFPKPLLIRMMPNIAIRHGMGVVGMVESNITSKLKTEITCLMEPLGLVTWLREDQVDALTSLTGSGPAFLFTIIDSMIDAGIAMDLTAQESSDLILQMLKGCVALLEKDQPKELIRQIASPNGTTSAGLHVMEQKNIKGSIIDTFLAALKRSRELANLHDQRPPAGAIP